MIPEVETLYASDEVKLENTAVTKHRDSYQDPDNEAPVTAWQRYQEFIAMMEASGRKIDRKLMLEAMFRGSDIAYTNH